MLIMALILIPKLIISGICLSIGFVMGKKLMDSIDMAITIRREIKLARAR